MSTIFAEPRSITSLDECVFYHSIDIPNIGTQEGMWDLRPNVEKYLGHVNLRNKRVLEVGTANGYLCFHMESQGAKVIAFDLADDEMSDIVPYARVNVSQKAQEMQPWVERIKNGFWLAHKELNSSAQVVYGNVYKIPREVGLVDVSTFGSILLHLRDPFLALQNALSLTRETVIITEPIWNWVNFFRFLIPQKGFGSYMIFVPDSKNCDPPTTWWHISPHAIKQFIAVLGFEKAKVIYHYQNHLQDNRKVPCFTVVGTRTVPLKQN